MGKKRILVVDDEVDIRIFVSTVVETIGFEPIEATNGSEAVEKARLTKPHLVILDIMMPKIEDGIKTYQQFRTDDNLADIPIIMLSAIAKKTFFHSIRMLNPRKDAAIASELVAKGVDGGFYYYMRARPIEWESINWQLRLIDLPELVVDPHWREATPG